MKKYLIKIDKLNGDAHSVFTIPDKELKAKILAVKLDEDEVTLGWPPKKWTVVEKDGEEYKCQEGRNTQYFPASEIDEAREEALLCKINELYPVHEHMSRIYGLAYRKYSDIKKRNYQIDIVDIRKSSDLMGGKRSNPTGVGGFDMFHVFKMYEYDGLRIQSESHGTLACMYFNTKGEFVNREYNVKLSEYTSSVESPAFMLDIFKDEIRKLGVLLTSAKRQSFNFFSDTHCYEIYPDKGGAVLRAVPHHKNDLYKIQGYPAIKRPKELVEITPDEIISRVISEKTEEIFNKY